MLLPVVTCFSVSSLIAPASTTSCMLLKREPSFNSMNVTPLESRRERTQPRRTISHPTARFSACLTEENCALILSQYRLTTHNVNGCCAMLRDRLRLFTNCSRWPMKSFSRKCFHAYELNAYP